MIQSFAALGVSAPGKLCGLSLDEPNLVTVDRSPSRSYAKEACGRVAVSSARRVR